MRFLFAPALLFFAVPVFAQVDSKPFNPDISVNLLGRYRHETHGSNQRTDTLHNGLSFEESEFQFLVDVDSYLRANVLFSVTQNAGTTDFGIDPEEAYIESISLPVITLRAGKFKTAFGKHNQLHTHAYPFIDAPLINLDMFGREGLNEFGVSGAVLLPTSWFSEWTLQAVSTNNDSFYNAGNSNQIASIGYLRNLWDLSDSSTLELGFYATRGKNSYDRFSSAAGADLIFKWRPINEGKYHAFIWQTEYIDGSVSGRPVGAHLGGLATWIQFQFSQRWWAQAREEYEGIPKSSGLPWKQRQSALLAFFPSEFSGFRLQYDFLQEQFQPKHHAIAFQYNISIGAHPAHAY